MVSSKKIAVIKITIFSGAIMVEPVHTGFGTNRQMKKGVIAYAYGVTDNARCIVRHLSFLRDSWRRLCGDYPQGLLQRLEEER